VQVFTNESVVHDYFSHFNMTLNTRNAASTSGTTQYTNFVNGTEFNSSAAFGGDLVGAFTTYVQLLNKYSYINGEWDLPSPVPEDLLLPWGDFVNKHNLSAMNSVAYSYNQGQGNLLAQPAFYVMRQLSLPQITGIANGFLVNPLGNQELYDRALKELGSSAFINSTITSIVRYDEGVQVCFETSSGEVTVDASKLLIAIPPKLANLHFLDLSQNEQYLFAQFNNSYYWNTILRNTGLAANTTYFNLNPDAPLLMPAQPAAYIAGPTAVEGVVGLYYGSAHYMTDAAVKADILSTISRIRDGAGLPEPEVEPEFVGFNNHSPYTLAVSTQAIRDGFYSQLKGLQGERRTWWTGAMWANDASGEIWNFTESAILPRIVAA
jgi:hypothetical protein